MMTMDMEHMLHVVSTILYKVSCVVLNKDRVHLPCFYLCLLRSLTFVLHVAIIALYYITYIKEIMNDDNSFL